MRQAVAEILDESTTFGEGEEEEGDPRSRKPDAGLDTATGLGYERSTSGTKHPGKVEGQTKRGGDEGSEERRVRARVSEPPTRSGPPAEAERPPRAARSSGGKDRHSKVNTAKGPRDRRVRLSVPTAVQFYDVQDRLGYDQPSKAVEWLIKHAKAAIDELAQLPPVRQGELSSEQPQQQQQPQQQPLQQQTSSASTFSAGLSGVLPTPSLIDSSGTAYGNYESHGQPPMVSASPFVHGAVEGMEPLGSGGPQAYGQGPIDPNFAREGEVIFRSASDVAGGSSGRVESRAKARERARERAKEKQYTGRDLDRETDIPGRGYTASSSAGHLAAGQYANFPSQVSSALQHPFQAPFPAPGNNQPGLRQPPYSYFPEAFSSPSFGGYPPPSYAQPEPSPSSFMSMPQSQDSVSQYLVENPPSAMGGRYPTGNTNSNFPGFSPTPPGSSSRVSQFSSLLSDPGYSSFPSQAGYLPSPYSSQPRPPSFSGQAPGTRLPRGTAYPPPSSHLVRPGHDRPVQSTPHSLDPNFYTPQIPSRLQGFEELEEEFKP